VNISVRRDPHPRLIPLWVGSCDSHIERSETSGFLPGLTAVGAGADQTMMNLLVQTQRVWKCSPPAKDHHSPRWPDGQASSRALFARCARLVDGDPGGREDRVANIQADGGAKNGKPSAKLFHESI